MHFCGAIEMHRSFAALRMTNQKESVITHVNPWPKVYSLFGFGLFGSA
jgi:hypothetical protein